MTDGGRNGGTRRTRRLLALAVLASAVLVRGAAAQATDIKSPPKPGFGGVIGVVDDSLRGGPLVGATVAVIGTPFRGKVDREGFYRIDSLGVGDTVQLAVLHPLLDTLYLVVTSPRFIVGAGKMTEMSLTTPTLRTVRERLCPRGGVITGRSMLVGRVDAADTDKPVSGALVSLVYTDPASGTSIQRVRSAKTRDDGLYVICGIPETLSGAVQAAFGAATTSDVPISIKEQLLVTTSFLMGPPIPADSARKGNAVLMGRVTDVAGAPIVQAQVAVEGGNSIATTGDDGSFVLRGLASGTTGAVIRKVGYAPALRTVHLRDAEPQRLAIVLAQGTRTLNTVTVLGKTDQALKDVGFTQRRNIGNRAGFLTPDEIEKRNARGVTDLFRAMPGFRVSSTGLGQTVEGTRSQMGAGQSGCVNIFVDRVPFEQQSPGDLDNAYPPTMIGAIETYGSASETPAEFQMPGRGCATIVMWTKLKLAKP